MTSYNEDNEWVVDDHCFVCKQKGHVIIRTLEGRGRIWRTRNCINMCTNPKCFRFSKRVPHGWIINNETEFEKAVRRKRDATVRDYRKGNHPRR